MRLHHDQHHAKYVSELNAALKSAKDDVGVDLYNISLTDVGARGDMMDNLDACEG